MGSNEAPAAAQPSGERVQDPRRLLAEAPMSRFQQIALAVIGLIYVLDGFDVMAISFVAPALLAEWGISKAELGYALSAGLFGMAIGSMLLSPLADALGRRRVLLGALGLMIAGTLWTALCRDIAELTASRLLTGLGIGATLGVVSPLAAEYANARRRDFAVSLTSIGYGVGAILGGFLSAWLLSSYGWRSVFYVASALGVGMMILAAFWVLEPLALVIIRPGRDGLARANAYLTRCGQPPIDALPPVLVDRGLPLAGLFGRDMAKDTLVLTLLYFCYVIPLFYMQTWTPALVAEIGLPASRAAVVAAALSVGGVTAGIVVAATSLRIGLKRLEAILLGGAAVMMVLFVLIPAQFALLLVGAAVTGFFLMGSMVGIWAIIARTFPTRLRASGTGFVLGVGRLGSALPPIFAGILFTAGFDRIEVSLVMAIPLVAALALLAILNVRPPDAA